MKSPVASYLLVLLLMALSGCRGNEVAMAPAKSPHFDAVSSHLQLGGTVYAYADIEGDGERAAEFLLTLLRDMPGLVVERGTHRLNARTLVRILGLDQVLAIGLSSYQTGELFHNRGFIHHRGQRAGLLRMFGGEPAEFGILALAPQGADWVWEQQLDLPALVDVIRELGALGVGISPEELDRALAEPALDLDIPWSAILERLETTAAMIVSVQPDQRLRIPGEAFWFPYTDFLLVVDGLSELGDAMARKAATDPFLSLQSTEDWTIISPAIELPPPWNAYQPSVVQQISTGRMFVVSSPGFMQRCLSTDRTVAATADFGRAFDDLPHQGNGLMYLSSRMTRQMHGVLDQIIAATGGSIGTSLARFFLPDAGYPAGWIMKNTEQGLLITSNTSSSHKSTLLTLGVAALLPAAAVVGVSALTPPDARPEQPEP